jgi:hypothetical protein
MDGRIDEDDGIELLHLESLRIDFANRFLVSNDIAEVDLRKIEMQFWRHDAGPSGKN